MPTPSPQWLDVYQHRLDWAVEAHGQFVQRLDPLVSAQLASVGSGASAVVYGVTQAGKTTVLLRFLGIAESEIATVSDVIRGGRPLGESATSVACTYHLVDGQEWHIEIPRSGTRWCNRHEARATLGKLRQQVTSGSSVPDGAVKVGIPRSHARVDGRAPLAVVYDLPGIGDRSSRQRAYLERIAPAYLEAADLVLLVSPSDHLGRLTPEDLQIEQLRDWVLAPDRYRIVLTFAFRADSTRDYLSENPEATLSDFRGLVIRQMHRFDGLPSADVLSSMINPIDTGDSWAALLSKRPDLVATCQRLNGESLRELVTEVGRVATLEHRVMSAAHTHELAQRIRKSRLAELTHGVKAAQQAEQALWSQIQRDKKAVDDCAARSDATERTLKALNNSQEFALLLRVKGVSIQGTDRSDRASVRKALDHARDRLEASALDAWDAWLSEVRATVKRPLRRIPHIEQEVHEVLFRAFALTRQRLDSHYTVLALDVKHKHSAESAFRALETEVKDARANLQKLLESKADRYLMPIRDEAATEHRRSAEALRAAAVVLLDRETSLKTCTATMEQKVAERKRTAEAMKQTIHTARSFASTMQVAYQHRLVRILKEIGAETREEERVMRVLEALTTARIAQRLELDGA